MIRIASVLLLALLTGCERQTPPPTVQAVLAENGPDQESWDPHYFITEEGRPRLNLRASYMAYFDRGDSTYMVLSGLNDTTRVHAEIFDGDGGLSANVVADRVTFYDRERRMVARGNVIVTGKEGRRVESEHLQWSEFQKTVSTPGFARITMPDQTMQGYGLRADEELTNVRLDNVTGRVLVEDQ